MCKKLSFEDVRPDFKKYYMSENNDGKLMSEIPKGYGKNVLLQCDKCNTIQSKNIRNYTSFPDRNFSCKYCKSLAAANPEIAQQWHPVKNGKLTPKDLAKSSCKRVWWLGGCGHEWEASPNTRTVQKSGCPYCSGNLLCKETSLGYLFPKIAKEWNHEKNGEMTPFEIAKASNKLIWWKCDKGHERKTSPSYRTILKRNCPRCFMSKGEKIIGEWLSDNNIKYEPQHYVKIENKRYYFDFYIPEIKLFVEIHGRQHFIESPWWKDNLETQQKTDEIKRIYAEKNGNYIMVDYREGVPKLALERFIDALAELP